MKPLLLILSTLIGIVMLGWLGLHVKSKPFTAYAERSSRLETVALPSGLPAPVERFYRTVYGENIPVLKTVVLTGRGTLTLNGITFPIRFRFAHEAGKNFRSDIDMTFFGSPIMHAREVFLDGHGRGVTPGGVDENEAWFDQSANIRMWAEALDWFPAILVTDPNVQWKPVDDDTALLVVPSGTSQDHLLVRFNPVDHSVEYIEAMKYKSADHKVLWINAIWMDDGKRWITLDIEETLFNVDVHDYIREP